MVFLHVRVLLVVQLAACTVRCQETRVFHRPPAAEMLTLAEAVAKLEDFSDRPHPADSKARRLAGKPIQSRNSWSLDQTDHVQQVNIAPGGPGEAVITWVTKKRGHKSELQYSSEDGYFKLKASGDAKIYTTQICLPNAEVMNNPRVGPPNRGFNFTKLTRLLNTSEILPATSDAYNYMPPEQDPWDVLATTNNCVEYKNPLAYYSSPYIHTVVLSGLRGRTKYTFQPEGSSRSFTFTTPADPGETPSSPFRMGVWGDVGITNISFSVMRAMRAWQLDVLLTVGDLSYADGWSEIWDVFGTLMEPLLSSVYHLAVPGNHEIVQNNGIDFAYRYPMPFRQSESESSFMFNYETGPVHVIGAPGSYAPTGRESPQWNFVAEKLSRVDRTRTPWVVVMFHTPWYNSNRDHHEEGLKHQWDMEELIYNHGVDFVLNGHVHSYERSFPVYNYTRDDCGTTHIVIGDGGNYEGPSTGGWMHPQPGWSAFREAAFGAGVITFHNATHAEWEWRRVACVTRNSNSSKGKVHPASLGRTRPASKFMWDGVSGPAGGPECAVDQDTSQQRYDTSDRVTIVRDVQKCPNKAMGSGGYQRRKQMSMPRVSFHFTSRGYRFALGACLTISLIVFLCVAHAFSSLNFKRQKCFFGICRVQPQFEALLGDEMRV